MSSPKLLGRSHTGIPSAPAQAPGPGTRVPEGAAMTPAQEIPSHLAEWRKGRGGQGHMARDNAVCDNFSILQLLIFILLFYHCILSILLLIFQTLNLRSYTPIPDAGCPVPTTGRTLMPYSPSIRKGRPNLRAPPLPPQDPTLPGPRRPRHVAVPKKYSDVKGEDDPRH